MERTAKNSRRIDWAAVVAYVFVKVPVVICPHCESRDYESTRSEPNGDGTTTTKSVCLACGKPFKVVRELDDLLPRGGNCDVGAL